MILYLFAVLNYFYNPPLITAETHDYHISRTQIEYVEEQQEWQLSVQIFIDDLELALEDSGHEKLRLGMKRELIDADTHIEAYLNQHLKFQNTDGERMTYHWLGKEMTEDLASFWVYLYIPNATSLDGITIENRLLTHLYEDQQNQVNVIDPSQRNHPLLFNKDYWKATVIFGKE